MTTNDTAGRVLLRCTDHGFTNFELNRRRATAAALASENMRGELTFHMPSLATFVDHIDHREYLLETVGPVLVVTNEHFGTTFMHEHLVPNTTPLGVAVAEGVLEVRKRLIEADIVQEVGTIDFNDPDLFRACHRDPAGHPVVVVNAGRHGWVQVHLRSNGAQLRSQRTGRTLRWRRRAILSTIGARLGAGTVEQTVTTLHGVAAEVFERAQQQPVFWDRNPAAHASA